MPDDSQFVSHINYQFGLIQLLLSKNLDFQIFYLRFFKKLDQKQTANVLKMTQS